MHSHLDWLPLAFSAHCRAPLLTTIHGFSNRRILPAYQRASFGLRLHLRRRPVARPGLLRDRLPRDRPRQRRLLRVRWRPAGHPRPHPSGQGHRTRDRDRPAGGAGSGDRRADPGPGLFRPLRGPSDRWPPGVLPRIGRAVGSLRPARWSARPAAPHRLRGAVRAVGGRGDGGRHTGDRVPAGFDAGDHRRRRHRVPGLGSGCGRASRSSCPDAGPARRSARWPRPGSAPSGW